MALIAAVIFDLGDTLVKTPWGIKLMEKGFVFFGVGIGKVTVEGMDAYRRPRRE